MPTTEQVNRLAALCHKAIGMLKAVQFSSPELTGYCETCWDIDHNCPVCEESLIHAKDCKLASLLQQYRTIREMS